MKYLGYYDLSSDDYYVMFVASRDEHEKIRDLALIKNDFIVDEKDYRVFQSKSSSLYENNIRLRTYEDIDRLITENDVLKQGAKPEVLSILKKVIYRDEKPKNTKLVILVSIINIITMSLLIAIFIKMLSR